MPKKKTNYIPARWDDYSPVGSVIKGTNFICFKVPLSADFRPKEKFTPRDLLSNLSTKGLRLGLIIDLTYTDRYYNGHTEFTRQGVQYLKLPIPGSKEELIPPEDCVQGFIRAIDDYLNSRTDPDALIGIHCTHGLNRTGYLVCSYMIDRLGLAPADAIAQFNIARGHKMEKYTGALMSRSTGGVESLDKYGDIAGPTGNTTFPQFGSSRSAGLLPLPTPARNSQPIKEPLATHFAALPPGANNTKSLTSPVKSRFTDAVPQVPLCSPTADIINKPPLIGSQMISGGSLAFPARPRSGIPPPIRPPPVMSSSGARTTVASSISLHSSSPNEVNSSISPGEPIPTSNSCSKPVVTLAINPSSTRLPPASHLSSSKRQTDFTKPVPPLRPPPGSIQGTPFVSAPNSANRSGPDLVGLPPRPPLMINPVMLTRPPPAIGAGLATIPQLAPSAPNTISPFNRAQFNVPPPSIIPFTAQASRSSVPLVEPLGSNIPGEASQVIDQSRCNKRHSDDVESHGHVHRHSHRRSRNSTSSSSRRRKGGSAGPGESDAGSPDEDGGDSTGSNGTESQPSHRHRHKHSSKKRHRRSKRRHHKHHHHRHDSERSQNSRDSKDCGRDVSAYGESFYGSSTHSGQVDTSESWTPITGSNVAGAENNKVGISMTNTSTVPVAQGVASAGVVGGLLPQPVVAAKMAAIAAGTMMMGMARFAMMQKMTQMMQARGCVGSGIVGRANAPSGTLVRQPGPGSSLTPSSGAVTDVSAAPAVGNAGINNSVGTTAPYSDVSAPAYPSSSWTEVPAGWSSGSPSTSAEHNKISGGWNPATDSIFASASGLNSQQSDEFFEEENDDYTEGEEDDEEDSCDSTMGQNLFVAAAAGGSSPGDAASSASIAAARRKRRNNLTKRFVTMKRGKFWEIKEVLEDEAERKEATKRKTNKPNK